MVGWLKVCNRSDSLIISVGSRVIWPLGLCHVYLSCNIYTRQAHRLLSFRSTGLLTASDSSVTCVTHDLFASTLYNQFVLQNTTCLHELLYCLIVVSAYTTFGIAIYSKRQSLNNLWTRPHLRNDLDMFVLLRTIVCYPIIIIRV